MRSHNLERAPFSIMGVHNADSAESSLHTLLAYPQALLSALISPVNVRLGLIGKELASGCRRSHGHLYPNVQERHQKTSYCMRRIAYTGQINQYTLECRGTIPGEAALLSSQCRKRRRGLINQEDVEIKTTHKAGAERTSPVAVIYSRLS